MKTLKTEEVYLAGYETFNDVADAFAELHRRRVQRQTDALRLGYRSPEEFEAQLAQQAA